jgi:hypothetical protein
MPPLAPMTKARMIRPLCFRSYTLDRLGRITLVNQAGSDRRLNRAHDLVHHL